LTENAKREIDGFFKDLEGSTNSGSASGRLFVVAGHTDSVGAEDYNYELGQRRAERVAGYLVGTEGVDPTQVRWSHTELASRLPITAPRAGGGATAGSKFSSTRRRS